MPSNYLILCHPLLLLPSILPSIRVFSNESVFHIRWPKYCSFSFSVSPSNEYSRLISFRIDWLDHLAVQGTLKSLFQHHSLKTSVLQCSVFFMVQLSHPFMTTGKTITLTRRTFVGKVMSLLFNMLSMFVITSFPASQQVCNSTFLLKNPSRVPISYINPSTYESCTLIPSQPPLFFLAFSHVLTPLTNICGIPSPPRQHIKK